MHAGDARVTSILDDDVSVGPFVGPASRASAQADLAAWLHGAGNGNTAPGLVELASSSQSTLLACGNEGVQACLSRVAAAIGRATALFQSESANLTHAIHTGQLQGLVEAINERGLVNDIAGQLVAHEPAAVALAADWVASTGRSAFSDLARAADGSGASESFGSFWQ